MKKILTYLCLFLLLGTSLSKFVCTSCKSNQLWECESCKDVPDVPTPTPPSPSPSPPTPSPTPSPSLSKCPKSNIKAIYLNSGLNWNDYASDLIKGTDAGYNVLINTFYLADQNVLFDSSLLWTRTSATDRKRALDYIHSKGGCLMLSVGGATDNPYNQNPEVVANRVAKLVKDGDYDGVDFNLENIPQGFQKGSLNYVDWIIRLNTATRNLLGSQYTISHAPVAPYFGCKGVNDWTGPSKGYTKINQETDIDYFIVQFYNQGPNCYVDYNGLFKSSCSVFPRTSILELVACDVPMNKIVLAKPIAPNDASNGYIPAVELGKLMNTATQNGICFRGYAGWQWNPSALLWNNQIKWSSCSPVPSPSPSPRPPTPVPSPRPPTPVPAPVPSPSGCNRFYQWDFKQSLQQHIESNGIGVYAWGIKGFFKPSGNDWNVINERIKYTPDGLEITVLPGDKDPFNLGLFPRVELVYQSRVLFKPQKKYILNQSVMFKNINQRAVFLQIITSPPGGSGGYPLFQLMIWNQNIVVRGYALTKFSTLTPVNIIPSVLNKEYKFSVEIMISTGSDGYYIVKESGKTIYTFRGQTHNSNKDVKLQCGCYNKDAVRVYLTELNVEQC